MRTLNLVIIILLLVLCSIISEIEGLSELERMEEYHRRGYHWPPRTEDYIPSTPGWQKLSERRLSQLLSIEDVGETYDGYMVTAHTAMNCKKFTENGWGLTRAPQVQSSFSFLVHVCIAITWFVSLTTECVWVLYRKKHICVFIKIFYFSSS